MKDKLPLKVESPITVGEKVIFTLSATKEQKEMLDLMALRHEVTRSIMFSRLISLHADTNVNIKIIADRLIANYCDTNIPFDQFLKSAAVWLESKKISTYYIERIIEEIKRNYE
jgi:hypothetical protein